MPKDSFSFRQFTIRHDRCAMKVGTDGVLLGAWAPLVGACRVLDIGAGSGLIALMLAQRTTAQVVGLEVDSSSAAQARENVCASPFADRVEIIEGDVLNAEVQTRLGLETFDAIVTNPPFFEETLASPLLERDRARRTAHLSYEALVAAADVLLSNGGTFSVILPAASARRFKGLASERNWALLKQTDVCTKEGKPMKRTLLHFLKGKAMSAQAEFATLSLMNADGSRSDAYSALCRDFYL